MAVGAEGGTNASVAGETGMDEMDRMDVLVVLLCGCTYTPTIFRPPLSLTHTRDQSIRPASTST